MINADIQKLEPGDKVRLFEVDGSAFGADVLRFHSCTLPYSEKELIAAGGDENKLPAKSIWWQGNEYGPWAVQVEGLEMSTDGQAAQPTLSVSNIDGLITALCLRFDDMAQAKVTIHDTMVHYLDAKNFPEGNPTADPEQEKSRFTILTVSHSKTMKPLSLSWRALLIYVACKYRRARSTRCVHGAHAVGTERVKGVITRARATSMRMGSQLMIRVRINAVGYSAIVKSGMVKTIRCRLAAFRVQH